MDASIRSRSAILTILVHAALFLILLFTAMNITIPPFPETGGGGGVLVNIGTLEEAAGDIQPMSETVSKEPIATKTQQENQPEEAYATQETEDAPVIKTTKEPAKKPVVKTEPKITQPKKIIEPVRTVNQNALYHGKTTASKSQGTGTGTGDQGDPMGDPNSRYTGKNGNGPGGPGPGEGGPGQGGNNKGISFTLEGRHMVRTPQITDHSQETGKVVVDITVDKDGAVISAVPGGRGSTTTSTYLFRLAKESAMKARFNADADASDIQKGTISFVFVVQ
jgi:outer membrane biosynthesis protein TonB